MYSDVDLKKLCQKLRLNGLPVKAPLDYLKDLIECTKADCCDGHIELCTGKECGDKPLASHELCCNKGETCEKIESIIVEEKVVPEGDVSHNNGDLRLDNNTPVPLSSDVLPKCQQNVIRETFPFPKETLRITGNSGGWLWVMGIQGHPSETYTAMKDALTTLKSETCCTKPY